MTVDSAASLTALPTAQREEVEGKVGRAPTPQAPAPAEPRIIGLDLSLRATGVASRGWVDTLTPPKNHKGYVRLRHIRERIREHTPSGHVDLVVVEGLAYDAHDTDRAGAGLWWIVTFDFHNRHVPFVIMTTGGRAKYATGKGNAAKDAVLAATVRRFPGYDIANNNEADALILAAAGYDHYGHPLVPMPETHRAALTAVDWPELAGSVI